MAMILQQAITQKEDRLELAIQAYQQGQFSGHRAAAIAYDVSQTTLQCRLVRIQLKLRSIAINRVLTSTEEESFI